MEFLTIITPRPDRMASENSADGDATDRGIDDVDFAAVFAHQSTDELKAPLITPTDTLVSETPSSETDAEGDAVDIDPDVPVVTKDILLSTDQPSAAPRPAATTPLSDNANPTVAVAAPPPDRPLPRPTPSTTSEVSPRDATAPPRQVEVSQMQLSRPPRMQTFPAEVGRRASAELTTDLDPVLDDADTLPLVRRRDAAITDGQALTRRQGNNTPKTATSPSQHPLPTMTPSSDTVPLRDASRPPTSEYAKLPNDTRSLTPNHSAVAAAYAAPMTPDAAPKASTKTERRETTELDPLLPRTSDGTPPAVDRSVAQYRPLPPAMAEQIATQLAQIAQNQSLQRRDIMLNPQELGRIRMKVQSQDGNIHVAILVERPETLDLMRRNINQLSAEFRGLGYQDVSFEFTQHHGTETATADPDPGSTTEQPHQDEMADLPRPTHPGPQRAGHLDLRI